MEFSGRGFKSHSGQLSIATSNNLSVVNTIYIVVKVGPQHTDCSILQKQHGHNICNICNHENNMSSNGFVAKINVPSQVLDKGSESISVVAPT